MKAWTLILAAGAIFALAAPAGYAATGHIPTDPSSPKASRHLAIPSEPSIASVIAKLERKVKALVATNKALAAKNKALAAKVKALQNRIVDPSPPPGGGGTVDPFDYCAVYMTDCTDEQLCADWGANCDLVPAPPATTPDESPVVPPAAETPVAYTDGALPEAGSGVSPSTDGSQGASEAEAEC
jgi:hypothetical protein